MTKVICGFFEDVNGSQLIKVFQNNVAFKEIYIDIYSDNPFCNAVRPVLMLRRFEKNVLISNNEELIIVKSNDKYNTYIAELMLNNVSDCYYKANSENNFEFVLNCQNIFYKINIFI